MVAEEVEVDWRGTTDVDREFSAGIKGVFNVLSRKNKGGKK